MTRLAGIFAVSATMILSLVPLLAGMALAAGAPSGSGNQYFNRIWQRTDLPVAELIVDRTWVWGPEGRTDLLTEPYAESPGGERTVQYFDKSRMEITHPDGDPDSVWYVTNGLLVVELISGQMQLGDDLFEDREPADVPVAGDRNDPNGPTYETLGLVLDAPAKPLGEVYVERLDRSGQVTVDQSLAAQDVRAAHIDEVTGHAIAGPFWAFMNSIGLVYENGQYIEGPMFQHALFGTGRPVAEAYWAEVLVAGTPTDVLLQCFERRCLTYNPSNPDGWQVEAGNVGIHYYEWRYGVDEEPGNVDPPPPPDPGVGDPPPDDPPVEGPPPSDPPPGDPPAGDVPEAPHTLKIDAFTGGSTGPHIGVRFKYGESQEALASIPDGTMLLGVNGEGTTLPDEFLIYRQHDGAFERLASVGPEPEIANHYRYVDYDIDVGEEYCYFVVAVNSAGESAPTETLCIRIQPPPDAPNLISPPDGYTSHDREITFQWEPVDDATGYVLCILKPEYVAHHCDWEAGPEYGQTVWTSASDGQVTVELPASLAPDGELTELTWSVTACDDSANYCGAVDGYRQLFVDLRNQLDAPTLVGEQADPNDPRRFTFSWNLVQGAERYIVCAAEPGANCEYETGNFYKSSVLGAGVNSYPLTIPAWLAPDGQNTNLNWTAAACDADLNCVWQYNFRSFIVQLDAGQELAPPALLSPPDGFTTQGNHAQLTWAPVDGAASYRVCIAYEIGARCPGNQVNMSAYFEPDVTSYNLWFHERKFKEFEWSVAACDESGDCVWQQQYHSLIFDRELDPPELVSAVADPNDPGRFTFSWNLVQGAERYIVCVAEPGANCQNETGAWYKSSVLGPSVDSYPMDIPLWLAPDGQVTNLNWKAAACDQYLNCSWGTGYSSIVVDRS